MSLFTIDPDACNRDAICVMDCPMGIIEMPADGGVPVPVAGAADLCIRCGHCVAVCPTGAFALTGMKPEDCKPVQPELHLSIAQATHALTSRRSIRVYKDKSIPKETLSEILELAAASPTGHNSRSVNWLAIHDTDKVREMTKMVADWMRYMIKEQPAMAGPLHLDRVVAGFEAGLDPICRNAPHLVMAHAHKSAPTGAVDCATALAYLELAAPSWGIGTCWAGFFNIAAMFWPPLQKALNLPKGHQNFGAAMIGYPKFKYHRIPPRTGTPVSFI